MMFVSLSEILCVLRMEEDTSGVDVREVLFVDEKECLEGRRGRGSVHLTFILLP